MGGRCERGIERLISCGGVGVAATARPVTPRCSMYTCSFTSVSLSPTIAHNTTHSSHFFAGSVFLSLFSRSRSHRVDVLFDRQKRKLSCPRRKRSLLSFSQLRESCGLTVSSSPLPRALGAGVLSSSGVVGGGAASVRRSDRSMSSSAATAAAPQTSRDGKAASQAPPLELSFTL